MGEYIKFTSGVENFLEEKITMPANENVKQWHEIYNYIMSKDIIIKWNSNPCIKMYYVVAGTWENNEHFKAYSEVVRKRLNEKRCYGEVETFFIDSRALVEIVNTNENNYKVVMDFLDSMPLPEVEQVNNSSVVLCNANEIVTLLSTKEGLLRRNLFEDNVRDYQGETVINSEIKQTLREEAQRFVLLNNGITIVCDEVQEGNRKISITNPQIVNGCQTCNVLFQSKKEGINIDNAYVIVKVIGSANGEIVNSIVKGTNRQNIVYEEAFEITKDFHKLLEKFFGVMEIPGFEKIFYERRAKQFDNNTAVKPYQRVSFRIMIQSFVSVFLSKANEGHRHESKLLHDYGNKIFVDNQSFYPYYVSAFIYTQIERMFRSGALPKSIYAYKHQIMLIFKEMVGGKFPNINQKKENEKYCKAFLDKVSDKEYLNQMIQKSSEKFEKIKQKWIDIKGESFRFAIKDSSDFTKFMLDNISGIEEHTSCVYDEFKLRGKVLSVNTDRHGNYFGFIKREPQNIFFHESSNPNISLEYEHREVTYKLECDKEGKEYAVNIELVGE